MPQLRILKILINVNIFIIFFIISIGQKKYIIKYKSYNIRLSYFIKTHNFFSFNFYNIFIIYRLSHFLLISNFSSFNFFYYSYNV